jgi:hypothetical protein
MLRQGEPPQTRLYYFPGNFQRAGYIFLDSFNSTWGNFTWGTAYPGYTWGIVKLDILDDFSQTAAPEWQEFYDSWILRCKDDILNILQQIHMIYTGSS